ncbi:serine/threonine-protein kinase [Streptomyces sp. NPDC020917]|uniref:serine/threonine-protein kinase n=1 Tax=Streptomyces sp. NPDC020917 TaxID=3365102 RepID=UPI0037A90F83
MPHDAGEGRIVAGRYRLAEQLGSGGFGTVWRARDQETGTDVALKEIFLPPSSSGERARWLARAEREARHAVELRAHPNVLAVHGVIVEDGTPWILMELVAGRSLAQYLDQRGALPPEQVAAIAAGLLAGLDAAHTAGIVHRDIKPSNVMLTDDGRVLLADFGIATRATDTALTSTGTFLGSAEYTAPERARGEDGNAASDLFSLGVTLYQAAEGVSPFRRELAMGALYAVVNEEPPPMVRAGALAPLITRLLDKDPSRRPTAAQALAALDGTRTAATTVPPTPTLRAQLPGADEAVTETATPAAPGPSPAAARRRRYAAGGAAAVVLVAVVALVVGFLTDGGASGTDGASSPPGPSSALTTTPPPPTTPPTTQPTTTPPTTAEPTTQAPTSRAAVPLSSLSKPCDAPSTSVRERFAMQGADHVVNKKTMRQCTWPGHYRGVSLGIVLQYLTAATVHDWVGTASPVSVRGLSGTMEHIGTASGGDADSCAIWWPTSFGSIGVIMVAPKSDSATACTDAESFVTAAAPDLPR